MDEELARLRAQMDQAKESAREMGPALWAFYSGCTEAGFTVEQGFALTIAWLTSLLGNAGADE